MRRPDPSTPDSLARARALRRAQTEPEKRLWSKLRNRQLAGIKFRRQVWIGSFIVDVFAADIRLIIEVDGDTHATTETQDAQRTEWLATEGYRVLRFSNRDVMENIDGVAAAIFRVADPSPSRSAPPSGPLPLPQGERGS